MRVLVTGNAGFMGSHLVDGLFKYYKPDEIIGIDDLSGGFIENVNNRCRFIQQDISSSRVAEIVKSMAPDVLFHLAADATEGRSQFTPMSATRRNLMGYVNVLTGAIQAGVKKVVLTSSMSVYGAQRPPFDETMEPKPEDVYAVNKAAMEKITKILSDVHGFNYTIIRPHNVFGERQNIRDPYRNVVGIFINRILRGLPPIIYGDGEQTRAFTHINNINPYIMEIGMTDKCNGEIVNIGPTESFTINYLAKKVLELMESPLKPIYYPARPKEVKHAYCTVDKATALLDYYTSVPFEEGLKMMVEWAKRIGPQELIYLKDLELVNDKTPTTWSKKEM